MMMKLLRVRTAESEMKILRTGIVDLPNGTIATFIIAPEIIQIMLHKNQMLRRYRTSLQFTQASDRNVHHEA